MITDERDTSSYKIRVKAGVEGYVKKGCVTKGFIQDLPPGVSPLSAESESSQPVASQPLDRNEPRSDETRDSSSKSPQKIARLLRSSTVLIVSAKGTGKFVTLGSGFAVGPGLIVTNSHVFPKGSVGSVMQIEGGDEPLKIAESVVRDDVNDLVILYVPKLGLDALPLSEKPSSPGDTIYVMGNPEGLYGTFSAGMVSAIRKSEDRDLIQITAPISHGSSGGPVVNSQGDVIGIAVSTLVKGQNLNFAVPVLALMALLSRIN